MINALECKASCAPSLFTKGKLYVMRSRDADGVPVVVADNGQEHRAAMVFDEWSLPPVPPLGDLPSALAKLDRDILSLAHVITTGRERNRLVVHVGGYDDDIENIPWDSAIDDALSRLLRSKEHTRTVWKEAFNLAQLRINEVFRNAND